MSIFVGPNSATACGGAAPAPTKPNLADEMNSYLDGLLAAAAPATTGKQMVFSTRDDATPLYVRNSTLWCPHGFIDNQSVWNSQLGLEQKRCLTLITPNCGITADHTSIPAGTTVRWVTQGNVTVTRTIDATHRHPDSINQFTPDMEICHFTGDITEIEPANLWPEDFLSYAQNEGRGLGVIRNGDDQKVGVFDTLTYHLAAWSGVISPDGSPRLDWVGDIRSGFPAVHLMADGTPIVGATYTSAAAGPNLASTSPFFLGPSFREWINDTCSAYGHTPETYDLSGYMKFIPYSNA